MPAIRKQIRSEAGFIDKTGWSPEVAVAPLIRHMELLHRASFGSLTTPVVVGGGVGLGMAHQLLHRGEIGANIQKIASKVFPGS